MMLMPDKNCLSCSLSFLGVSGMERSSFYKNTRSQCFHTAQLDIVTAPHSKLKLSLTLFDRKLDSLVKAILFCWYKI